MSDKKNTNNTPTNSTNTPKEPVTRQGDFSYKPPKPGKDTKPPKI